MQCKCCHSARSIRPSSSRFTYLVSRSLKIASSTSTNGRLKQLTNSVSHGNSNTREKIGKCLLFQRSLRKPLNQLYEIMLVGKKKKKMEIPKIKKFLRLVHDQLSCSKGGLVVFYSYSYSTSIGYDKFDIHHL